MELIGLALLSIPVAALFGMGAKLLGSDLDFFHWWGKMTMFLFFLWVVFGVVCTPAVYIFLMLENMNLLFAPFEYFVLWWGLTMVGFIGWSFRSDIKNYFLDP